MTWMNWLHFKKCFVEASGMETDWEESCACWFNKVYLRD